MGDDTIYSGTVGAAMEGYLMGVPSIAFSQVDRDWVRIQDAAAYAKHLVQDLMSSHQASSSPWLLNVNIPNLPVDQLGPPKVCRLGRRHPAQRVITQESPRGETRYWIGGAGSARDEAHDTDFFAASQGHVSITPLQVDLTEHAQLTHWKSVAENWGKIA